MIRDARGHRAFHFFGQEVQRGFRFRDVIDAGRAATNIRVGQFHEFQAGDRAQQLAGSLANFLAVEQVAGILIGDARGDGLHRRGEPEGSKKLSDVADILRECRCGGVFGFAGSEQAIVFLKRGTATRGVGDDRVEISSTEGGEIATGQFAGDVAHTSMQRQGAAAELTVRDNDFASVCREDADGGFVQRRESDICDATREEGHAGAAGTLRGVSFAELVEEKPAIHGWQEQITFRKSQEFENSRGPCQSLQSGSLIKAHEFRRGGDAIRIGQQPPVDEISRQPRKKRALVFVFDARAGVRHQLSVVHRGGAGGFAGAAVEAPVNVLDESVRNGKLTLLDQKHLANAAARRIGFQLPQTIGRAVIQAQAAVNAARKILVGGNSAGDRRLRGQGSEASHEAAGGEYILRIEGGFHTLHQRKIRPGWAPDVAALLQPVGSVQDRRGCLFCA